MSTDEPLDVGVVGVGAMGQHHARVYSNLSEATLVGVADTDDGRANEIATRYATKHYGVDELIERVDAVSIVVPTAHHYDLAVRCIEAGVDVLIEKPIVEEPDRGRDLVSRAEGASVTLQVGHIERHNPVVSTLQDILPDLDVIAIEAERLGPAPDREIYDSAVIDLMIHDIDVVRSLFDATVDSVDAIGNANGRYATASLELDNGVVGTLTASRVTQQKKRSLTITAKDCFVACDFLDQSIKIHRQSVPEFIADDGSVKYRHESVVEHPAVSKGEPLEFELSSFLAACRNGAEPKVTGQEGIRALELAREINEKAFGSARKTVQVIGE